MIQKVNLKENANMIDELLRYKRVGTLNNHMLNVLQAENRTFLNFQQRANLQIRELLKTLFRNEVRNSNEISEF